MICRPWYCAEDLGHPPPEGKDKKVLKTTFFELKNIEKFGINIILDLFFFSLNKQYQMKNILIIFLRFVNVQFEFSLKIGNLGLFADLGANQ